MAQKKATKVTALVVSKGGRGISPAEKTPEQIITTIRGFLDKMEVVQLQHATGAILIGLELLALKDQLGHGEFKEVFAQQIERPRFSYRSAARYMQDANRIRRKMAKDGGVTLMGILNIAPSALPIARQRELQGIISEAVGNRNLSALRGALGTDQPKQITAGQPAMTAKDAELQAHARIWMDLCRKITHEAVTAKTWKHLTPDARKVARNSLKTALESMPE